MKNTLWIILLVAGVVGCTEEPESFPVETTLIGKGNLHGNGGEGISKQSLVISDAGTWASLMTQMNSVNNVSDGFSETDIDFVDYRVIAVFDEIRPTDGFAVKVNITKNETNIVVRVTYSAPDGVAATVITQPFHIVKISSGSVPVVFQ